jgi:hypothetical protein
MRLVLFGNECGNKYPWPHVLSWLGVITSTHETDEMVLLWKLGSWESAEAGFRSLRGWGAFFSRIVLLSDYGVYNSTKFSSLLVLF